MILTYIKENKKKLLIILLIAIVLAFVYININNQRKVKIYLSESYVYTKESNSSDIGSGSSLPYINIKGGEVSEINSNLVKKYYEITAIDKEVMKYEYFVNKNILSLIVKIYNKESVDSLPSEVIFYNIDIATGEIINDNELLSIFSISKDEVLEIIKNDLKDYYDYEISKKYIDSKCDFDCYLNDTRSLPLLDNCNYYVKDNYLMVYKRIMVDRDFFYDENSGYELFNFELKKR